MENTPRGYEEDEEDESVDNKKKTRLGLFAISNETPDKDKDERSWFSRLGESNADKDEKPKEVEEKKEEGAKPKLELVKPLEETPAVVEAEPVIESEPPIEEPSKTELQEVVRPRLIEEIEEVEADKDDDPITDPPVNKFRDLVKSGEEPNTAFDEVMTEMNVEETEIVELDSEQSEEQAEVEPNDGMLEIEEIKTESEPEIAENVVAENDNEEEPETPQSDAQTVTPPVPPAPAPTPTPSQQHNTQPTTAGQVEDKPATTPAVSGIVTYLVGRRHGRAESDKSPQPIQEKLEEKVQDIKLELDEKEKKIRRIAAAKAQKDGPQVIESFKKERVAEEVSEPEESEEQVETPEISVLQAVPAKPEHIGRMMVMAEAEPETVQTPEVSATAAASDQVASIESIQAGDRQLETMNRTELLAISEKIIIDGSSLRQIFETHLIGERGLRRIIAEHMRGGDLKKALQKEIVEREVDFETAPGERQRDEFQKTEQGSFSQSADLSSSSSALNSMLEKASTSIGGNEEAAFIRARAAYEEEQTDRQAKQRRIIDVSFAAIIGVLTFVVIYLIISRI